MAKIYTAQEMREAADKLESRKEYAVCCFDANDNEWRPAWQNPDSIVLALRQAAAMMEHDKKYEYEVHYTENGVVLHSAGRAHSLKAAKCILAMYKDCDGAVIVRRPVGEWEEVKDGE